MDSREETLNRLRGETPTLIGLGAIGSWIARWLTANGITFYGYDNDIVSLKNLAAGAFQREDVGHYKSDVFGGNTRLWDDTAGLGHAALVCADHGPTRRLAAKMAVEGHRPFLCAKANGSLWQVWHLPVGSRSAEDFIAFDEAAEQNPVTVPCGDPSVGRIASVGAAAELLSVWTGLEISTEEVEAAFGVEYDPAIGFALAKHWESYRAEAELVATEAAQKAFKKAIEVQRSKSDREAEDDLLVLRETRAARKIRQRSTIHQKAIVSLDSGNTIKQAARYAVGTRHPLRILITAESQVEAQLTAKFLSVPETVTIREINVA